MSLLQEVTGVTESSHCQQVATQLVELHVNNECLRQCVDELKHAVNSPGVSFTNHVQFHITATATFHICLTSFFPAPMQLRSSEL